MNRSQLPNELNRLTHEYEVELNNSMRYFTIVSLVDNNTIGWKASNSSLTKTISVSLDNGATWTPVTSTTSGATLATLSANQKMLVKGSNATYSNNSYYFNYFTSTGNFNVEGNIMSLVNGDDFIGQKTLDSAGHNFKNLFYQCTYLIDAVNLILPATTLATYCYSYMFSYCSKLSRAPELPATTLASYCYYSMFNGCTSLTKAPELPATTLASSCYNNMFYGCTSLTKAPELPATTLATYCYANMFQGCTSLTKTPELPATTLAESCYANMFQGCKSLTKTPELPATTLATRCYSSMFWGCTSLTKAPELPATTLANGCYYYMFSGCTSLNYIKCLATDISASGRLTDWVTGVSSTGTFVKADSMSSWTTGTSGIPTGWTIYTNSEYEEVRHHELVVEKKGNELYYKKTGNLYYPINHLDLSTNVPTMLEYKFGNYNVFEILLPVNATINAAISGNNVSDEQVVKYDNGSEVFLTFISGDIVFANSIILEAHLIGSGTYSNVSIIKENNLYKVYSQIPINSFSSDFSYLYIKYCNTAYLGYGDTISHTTSDIPYPNN